MRSVDGDVAFIGKQFPARAMLKYLHATTPRIYRLTPVESIVNECPWLAEGDLHSMDTDPTPPRGIARPNLKGTQ